MNFKNFSIFERLELRSIASWWDNLMYFCFTFSFIFIFTGIIINDISFVFLGISIASLFGILCQVGEIIELKKIIKIQNEQRKALRNMAKKRNSDHN